jgi:hypothetical protein
VIPFPVYDRSRDGNVFEWILIAADAHRELRRIETNAAKEASAELKRMDSSKVEN